LNFLVGLAGDSNESLKLHAEFLARILEEGLMLRRINIRKPMLFENTPLKVLIDKYPSRIKENRYKKWKEWVRSQIDQPLLKRLAPLGCIIKNLRIEEKVGNLSFGRQLATYPLLVGVVDDTLPLGTVIDAAVTDYGRRSLTAVPFPLDLNSCPPGSLTAIPGIGRARASRIISQRPFSSFEKLKEAIDDEEVAEGLKIFTAL
jgi:radical SAM superfamily enzyme with C-terminal helix-hairpin-helix motif